MSHGARIQNVESESQGWDAQNGARALWLGCHLQAGRAAGLPSASGRACQQQREEGERQGRQLRAGTQASREHGLAVSGEGSGGGRAGQEAHP